MTLAVNIFTLFLFCLIPQLELRAQNALCAGFEQLVEIEFGSNQYKTKKRLLSSSTPFIQDEQRKIRGVKTDFFMPLSRFNVPEAEYNEEKYQSLRDDSVYITQAYFKLPSDCVSQFENKVDLTFADDTLYYITVEITFPPEKLREAIHLFDQIELMMAENYPSKVEYELKAFDSDEIGGEGIEYSKSLVGHKSDTPDREVGWLHMRNYFSYAYDNNDEFVSTGNISYYRVSLSIVNYRVTRLNGLGSYL